MSDDRRMTFLEHLEELRQRIIKSALAVLIGMIGCWFFRDQILSFLLAPLYTAWDQVEGLAPPEPLNYTSLLEPFIAYLKLSAIGGLFVGAPVVLYQLWMFVAPGLYPREKRLALPFVLVSSVLFIGGSIMAYTIIFPLGFQFFLDFASRSEMIELESRITLHGASASSIGEDEQSASSSADQRRDEPERGVFEKLMIHLEKRDCGRFWTALSTTQPGVKLLFTWDKHRCGDPPPLDDLRRNDLPLTVSWHKQPLSSDTIAQLEADDKALAPGDYHYKLRIPVDPDAPRLTPVLMIQDYLSLAIQLILAFGLIFELPILISFLSLAGIVNYKQLLNFSRWFIVLAFVVGAILTPPDALTQIMLALPLIVLYFLSVLVAYFFGDKPNE